MNLTVIEMSLRKAFFRHINPVAGDETVAVFDIDYCLYSSPQMHKMERDLVKADAVNKYNVKDWDNLSGKYFATKELFYKEFGVHPSEFHKLYENFDFTSYFDPDPVLRNTISSLKCRKFCFTNASAGKAIAVLKHLDMLDCFEAVICADSEGSDFYLKPQNRSFEFVDKYLGICCKSNVYFFDDKKCNVISAQSHGWNSFQVQGDLNAILLRLIREGRLKTE